VGYNGDVRETTELPIVPSGVSLATWLAVAEQEWHAGRFQEARTIIAYIYLSFDNLEFLGEGTNEAGPADLNDYPSPSPSSR